VEDACAPGSGNPLRLEVVRTLARDLKRELETLSVLADGETGVVEGALRAADVANLAASSLAELSRGGATKALAAAHLAAGAARALHALGEGVHARGEDHEAYALRDARSAGWRARLVARQVDEFLAGAG
jgi:hypothetical protein